MLIESYYCPRTLQEATEILERYKTDIKICAGGTDLFVMMRKGKSQGRYLLDLGNLPLRYIRQNMDGTISVGAMTTLTEVADSPLLNREPFLFLQEAARHVGSHQIRNVATLVGNICTGIPSADTAEPLLALNAQIHLVSSGGERYVSAGEFFKGPRKIEAQPNELVTEVIFRADSMECSHTFFRKVGTRREMFISLFSVAALLKIGEDGSVKTAGIAMGVVAPTPLKLRRTEEFLCGKRLDDQAIAHALQIMQTEIHPRSSFHGSEEYRRTVASNLLRNILMQARDA